MYIVAVNVSEQKNMRVPIQIMPARTNLNIRIHPQAIVKNYATFNSFLSYSYLRGGHFQSSFFSFILSDSARAEVRREKKQILSSLSSRSRYKTEGEGKHLLYSDFSYPIHL